MSILKVDHLVAIILQSSYSLVHKIEICLKFFRQKFLKAAIVDMIWDSDSMPSVVYLGREKPIESFIYVDDSYS